MRFRTLFLFMVLAITALFALLNWQAFTTPATLSVVFGTVEAPIGLVMLGVVFVLGAMCLTYLIYVQGTALMQSHRHSKELQSQRDLVEKVESSRFTELRSFVDAELQGATQRHADAHAQILTRLEQLEQRMRVALQETGNSLSADIGELEHRIDHRPNGSPGDQVPH